MPDTYECLIDQDKQSHSVRRRLLDVHSPALRPYLL